MVDGAAEYSTRWWVLRGSYLPTVHYYPPQSASHSGLQQGHWTEISSLSLHARPHSSCHNGPEWSVFVFQLTHIQMWSQLLNLCQSHTIWELPVLHLKEKKRWSIYVFNYSHVKKEKHPTFKPTDSSSKILFNNHFGRKRKCSVVFFNSCTTSLGTYRSAIFKHFLL